MKTNTKTVCEPVYTLTGTRASRTSKLEQLCRMCMACMLWENNAYQDGVSAVETINTLSSDRAIKAEDIASLAVRCRKTMKLRHVPLLLLVNLIRRGELRAKHVTDVISRPDELCELISLYWKDGKRPLPNQMKLGLADAFQKFDAYQLAKYQGRDRTIKLKDVMKLVHPKPVDAEQSALWKSVIDGTIKAPDTWEVSLSAGKSKKETFERLMAEGKLGSDATLKNLRNMEQSGVDSTIVNRYLSEMSIRNVLPFRFLIAARHAPRFIPGLEQAMMRSLKGMPKLSGKTVVVVDCSGSMGHLISSKSELSRFDAAMCLAMLIRGISDDCYIYLTAGDHYNHATTMIPAYQGFALRETALQTAKGLGGGGIFLQPCMEYVANAEKTADRVIVITDEQDCSGAKYNPQAAKAFGKYNYILNIASSQHGIAYNKFMHVNGFSEASVAFIQEWERYDISN